MRGCVNILLETGQKWSKQDYFIKNNEVYEYEGILLVGGRGWESGGDN